ncbi:unnamed protein product [Ceratitis capitata]|uniref:(Mediterranean fruit fly) hypothetical protein n=1 Tax=Ceratitis capitata TaxID=7213 RepID=A0A811VDV3_CERCA|nr:unnamed protein product [Ceratitis capitata]
MPVFDYDHGKLDMKSKHLAHIVPPPLPGKGNDHINYYAAKPKKLPKKFNAGTKQKRTDPSGQLPKAVYLLNDERNRINFDDLSLEEEHVSSANAQDEFLNQGEEGGEEDLVAAATGQSIRTVARI